jgi:YVTN family beta-propeller protein
MAVRYARDGKHVYVANYLGNSVQVVDVPGRKVARTIDLGGPRAPSLARQGEAIFYDGHRSLDQWYSCHSCHYEGHVNATSMDTRNDGSNGTFKTVLSLRNVTHTGPWTWHGWQKDLKAAMVKSITDTMLSKRPSDDDVKAMIAYLQTLRVPPNPYRNADGSLTEAARREDLQGVGGGLRALPLGAVLHGRPRPRRRHGRAERPLPGLQPAVAARGA